MVGVTVQQLLDGDRGIYQTAEKMVAMIREDSVSFYVRSWAEAIIAGVRERDKWGEVKAVYNFVKNNIRYTHDMIDMEYVKGATFTLQQLEQGQTVMGDCDDYTVLMLSLLRSIGFMVQVKLTGYAPSDEFTHVYGEVFMDRDGWIPLDGIVRNFAVGDEAPNPARVALYPV